MKAQYAASLTFALVALCATPSAWAQAAGPAAAAGPAPAVAAAPAPAAADAAAEAAAAAKAKAAEAAAKAAHGNKVANYQLCTAQDRVATAYLAEAKKAGKPTGAVVATAPCANPGPFVYTPAAAAAPQK